MHHSETNKQTNAVGANFLYHFLVVSESVAQLKPHNPPNLSPSSAKCFLCVYFLSERTISEVNVAHRMETDIKLRLLQGFVQLRGPKTHEHTYYYLCKHVILLSNEPFTVSVMKQLALTQAK